MGNEPGKPGFHDVEAGAHSTAGPAKPDFSQVQAGSASSAAGAVQTHTVVSGDTLSKIAQKVYGDANRWRDLFEANRDQLDNPDLIKPGQVLKIPV